MSKVRKPVKIQSMLHSITPHPDFVSWTFFFRGGLILGGKRHLRERVGIPYRLLGCGGLQILRNFTLSVISSPFFIVQILDLSVACSRLVPFHTVLTRSRGLGWISRYSESLRVGWSGDRIPMAAGYSELVLTCKMGTGSLSFGGGGGER
jgi:hypothetical protein